MIGTVAVTSSSTLTRNSFALFRYCLVDFNDDIKLPHMAIARSIKRVLFQGQSYIICRENPLQNNV